MSKKRKDAMKERNEKHNQHVNITSCAKCINPVKVLAYDEYVFINYKDKIDRKRQPTREYKDDKEMTSEHLIKAFSTYSDDTKEEVHKVANE